MLTVDATADTPSPGGSTYGTRGSFTLRIVAPDFRAEHVTSRTASTIPRMPPRPGQAVFVGCDIVSRDRGSATNNGYITAPSTDSSHAFGFLFLRSRLLKERPTLAAASVTLGRPWHSFADPRAIGSSVVIDCFMDNHIGAKGWPGSSLHHAWRGVQRA